MKWGFMGGKGVPFYVKNGTSFFFGRVEEGNDKENIERSFKEVQDSIFVFGFHICLYETCLVL